MVNTDRIEGATGIQRAEARGAAKHPTMRRTAPQQRMIQPRCHVPRLRSPANLPDGSSPELAGAIVIIVIDAPFIKCLPCARNCAKRFTYIILEAQASSGATPWGLCRFPFL